MSKTSVLIPARNEPYLQKTVDEVFEKRRGDTSVIVICDGYQAEPPLRERDGLDVYTTATPHGMRASINAAASVAFDNKSDYILKLDAHCALSEGFDVTLAAGLQEDTWVTIPRFYTLDAERWQWQDEHYCDYYYLSCPMTDPKQFRFSTGGYWWSRTEARKEYTIDDAMIFHGSCWMMSMKHFQRIGPLEAAYGTHGMEPQEICFKTWLGPWDGRVIVNKQAWNAHMHKGRQRPRGYYMGKTETYNSYDYCARYWMADSWPKQTRKLEWLIDKFMPVPSWPDNWRELYQEWKVKDAAK